MNTHTHMHKGGKEGKKGEKEEREERWRGEEKGYSYAETPPLALAEPSLPIQPGSFPGEPWKIPTPPAKALGKFSHSVD